MPERLARVETLSVPPRTRLLVVSDIHGNRRYLHGVLKQVGFNEKDLLIVDGDFLEKGPDSLGTLHDLMALHERGLAKLLLGNCDGWHEIFELPPEADEKLLRYMLYRKSGLLWEMCNECCIDPFSLEDLGELRQRLRTAYAKEWAFLASLPDAIETGHYLFVHAAVSRDKPLREHLASELNTCQAFLRTAPGFDKWVIVGHYPVVLYGSDTVCANPVLDRSKRIVSIDGGCVLKDDGQLNCLIIPYEGSEDFQFAAYDSFPERGVLQAQQASERSYYIRWGDNRVKVLRRGEEFSLCRHLRTGYTMEILTKYLFSDEEITECNDCTDYVLPLSPGDRVRVVECTSRGYFVKHKGVSGWYYGELGP